MPTENKIAAPEGSAGVDFGIDGRSVRVSQEAYSIFLAREAAGREKIAALQQRLTAADERLDVLEGLLRKTLAYFTEPGMPEDLLAEFKAALADSISACTWQYGAFSWHTACGQEWMLNDGTPEQNGMRFCHSCGKTLVVDEKHPESERES